MFWLLKELISYCSKSWGKKLNLQKLMKFLFWLKHSILTSHLKLLIACVCIFKYDLWDELVCYGCFRKVEFQAKTAESCSSALQYSLQRVSPRQGECSRVLLPVVCAPSPGREQQGAAACCQWSLVKSFRTKWVVPSLLYFFSATIRTITILLTLPKH
jgi:hypothetical protein